MKTLRFLNKLKNISNYRFTTVKPMESKPEKELPPPTEEDFYKVDIRIGEITECWKVSLPPSSLLQSIYRNLSILFISILIPRISIVRK